MSNIIDLAQEQDYTTFHDEVKAMLAKKLEDANVLKETHETEEK